MIIYQNGQYVDSVTGQVVGQGAYDPNMSNVMSQYGPGAAPTPIPGKPPDQNIPAWWQQQYGGSAAPAQPPSSPLSSRGTFTSQPDAPNDIQWMPTGTGNFLTLRGPNGETQQIDAGNYQQIAGLLGQQGWQALDPQGQPYSAVPYGGGNMYTDPVTGQSNPLNVLLGGQLSPSQQQAMPDFMKQYPTLASRGDTAGVAGVYNPATGGTTPPAGTNAQDFNQMFNLSPIPSIPGINLGAAPQMAGQFSPDFQKNYFDVASQIGQVVPQPYDIRNSNLWSMPTMNSAQMNTGQVPQTQATLPQGFPALQFLLSGQGFQPDTLARMNAQAIDQTSQQGAGQLSAAKIAMQQAGLDQSGGPMAAIAQQVAADTGAQRQQALNQISIQNAMQGMQNMQMGTGIQANMNMGSAQMANQVALQNAANMFSAMTQNLANQQATNTANFTAAQQRGMAGAQQQSDYTRQMGQNYQAGQIAQGLSSGQFNPQMAANWGLQQANLTRQGDLANADIQNQRFGQGLGALVSLYGGSNPAGYTGQNASLSSGYQPLNLGGFFSGPGQSVLNSAISGTFNPGGRSTVYG